MHDKRLSAIGYTSERLDTAGIKALDAADWDRLSAAVLTDNPFYSRQYVLAGLGSVEPGAGLDAVAIRNGAGRLVGLFPFRKKHLLPFLWPVARGAENLYQFSGMPLVEREAAPAVVDVWLDGLLAKATPAFWVLGNFDSGGPLKGLIEASAASRGLATRLVVPYPRPHLTGLPGGMAAHASEVIAKGRLKDIQRNLRRLREMGEVVFERATVPALVRSRLEQFLAMEQAGWKGQGGTAFMSDERHADFARRAFAGAAGMEGLASIDSLLLDGQPIAMSINIASGNTAFTPKCTYDEDLRKYGPGLALEYLIVERFYAAGEYDDMDAATTTGGHLVLGLWDAQKPMGRLIVGPAGWRTDLLAAGWQAAYDGKQALKRLLKRR